MRCISLLPLLVAGTRNLSLTRGVVKMRVLFSGALAQIIVRFYPVCDACDGLPSGTVRRVPPHPLRRVLSFTCVMVAIALGAGGCDGVGRSSAGASTGAPTTTPAPPTTPSATAVTK